MMSRPGGSTAITSSFDTYVHLTPPLPATMTPPMTPDMSHVLRKFPFIPTLALLLALMVGGCASSVKTTLPSQWSAQVPVQEQITMNVSPYGDYVFLIHEKDVTILDGATGRVTFTERESLMDKVFDLGNLSVGGVQLNTSAPRYQQLYVDHAGLALLFDYSADDDVIRAINPRTGEDQWKRDDFNWSLAKYNSLFGQTIGRRVAQALAGRTGTNVDTEPLDQRFVRDLSIMLPERELFLFKSVDGLVRMELATGDVVWRIREFEGMGIGSVVELPDGDLIVVSKAGESIMSSFTGENHVARLDPETGELRWLAEFSAGAGGFITGQSGQADGAYVRDGVLIIDTMGRFQGYDVETGEALWHVDRQGPATVPPLATADGVYAPAYVGEAVQIGMTYALQHYDLRSGDVQWSTEDSKTTFSDLALDGDRVVAAASGDLFDGAGGLIVYDAKTGRELWQSAPFAKKGLLSSSTSITNMIVEGGTAYVAGPVALHAFDVSDGTQRFQFTSDETGVGPFGALIDDGDQLIAIGRYGVIFVQKAGGELVDAITAASEVTSHDIVGDHLFLNHEEATTVVDLQGRQKVGVGAVAAPEAVYGDLRSGMFVTVDGRHVYLLHGNSLQKYQLRR